MCTQVALRGGQELKKEVVGTTGRKGTTGMAHNVLDAARKVPAAAAALLLHMGACCAGAGAEVVLEGRAIPKPPPLSAAAAFMMSFAAAPWRSPQTCRLEQAAAAPLHSPRLLPPLLPCAQPTAPLGWRPARRWCSTNPVPRLASHLPALAPERSLPCSRRPCRPGGQRAAGAAQRGVGARNRGHPDPGVCGLPGAAGAAGESQAGEGGGQETRGQVT